MSDEGKDYSVRGVSNKGTKKKKLAPSLRHMNRRGDIYIQSTESVTHVTMR